jgi:hypothetical protein
VLAAFAPQRDWVFLTTDDQQLAPILDDFGQRVAVLLRGRHLTDSTATLKVSCSTSRTASQHLYSTGLMSPELVLNECADICRNDHHSRFAPDRWWRHRTQKGHYCGGGGLPPGVGRRTVIVADAASVIAT